METESKMSEIFEIDVGELEWLLEITETFVTNVMKDIKNKELKKEELPEIFEDLERKMFKLNFLHTLISAKAVRYRLDNKELIGFVNSTEPDLFHTWNIATDAKVAFKENPNRDMKEAYNYLKKIRFFIKEIRKRLKDAIKRNLFI